MTQNPIAVLAAGGKTARAVLAALAARGVPCRAVHRQDADLDTGAGLPAALAGCAAVWLAAPNLHPDEPALLRRVLTAATRAGVGRIVYHSVAWPYAPAMPHHLAKAQAEDEVRRSGLAFTILQPCAYTQNLVPGALAGRVAVPYSIDVPFSFVDLADVAAATATVLAEDGHLGASYELGGPQALSVRGFGAAAASVLGHPVTVGRVSTLDWLAGPGAGLDGGPRGRLLAMFAGYDASGFVAGHRVLEHLLGRRGTDVSEVLRATSHVL